MTHRVSEWDYEEINSIIAKLSNAYLELANTPIPSTSDIDSEHDAILSRHVTALDSICKHMAWTLSNIYLGLATVTEDFMCADGAIADAICEIQCYNDEYNRKYTPLVPAGNTQITAMTPSPS